jgi:short-subunit dehydrogenase
MRLNLEGKTVLITGGSKGIGFATAESFAEEGVAHLHLTSRTQEDLDVCKAELLSKFPALKVDVYALDLSNPDAVASLADQVGWVDILVNNAGAIPSGPIEDLTLEGKRLKQNAQGQNLMKFARTSVGHIRPYRSFLFCSPPPPPYSP